MNGHIYAAPFLVITWLQYPVLGLLGTGRVEMCFVSWFLSFLFPGGTHRNQKTMRSAFYILRLCTVIH